MPKPKYDPVKEVREASKELDKRREKRQREQFGPPREWEQEEKRKKPLTKPKP